MRPIRLNMEGDTICQAEGKKIPEDWPFASFFGDHYLCGGDVSVVRISEETLSLNCSSCGRLLTVPSYVDTIGRLRSYLAGVKLARK